MSTPIVRRRKKPVEVDTIQWTGNNLDDLVDFTNGRFFPDVNGDFLTPGVTARVYDRLHSTWVGVKTGQHIVRGVAGEFYPIAEDVLADTYEPVEEEATAAAATATPDFFVPGRTYTNTDRYKLTIRFACEHLTVDPQNGRREAWGWLHRANGSRCMQRLWADDYPQWTPKAGDR